MDIQHITRLDEFDALREAWESTAAADPHANVFVSWAWLRGWFEHCPHNWLVLAARPDAQSPHVGFLPLGIDPTPAWFRLDQQIILRLGAFPAADYTGFVCRPEHKRQALSAFADYVQNELDWDRFEMREVSDPALGQWLQEIDADQFDVASSSATPCPQIDLTDDWEAYLRQCVSPATRKTLRRRLRGIEQLDGFNMTDASDDNLAEQIDTVLALWTRRWPGRATSQELDCWRSILTRCHQAGSLWLRVLWRDRTPIAAAAGFIDLPHRRFCGYILGVNPDFRDFSPGTVLIAHAIRDCIERGLKHFDFLRGDEAYKYSFGATDRFNQNVTITRNRLRTTMRAATSRLRDRLAIRTRTRAALDWLRQVLPQHHHSASDVTAEIPPQPSHGVTSGIM